MQRRRDLQLGYVEYKGPSLDEIRKILIKCCNVSLRMSNALPRYHGRVEAIKQKPHDLSQATLRLGDKQVQ
jgi:hypothetical protein